MRKADLSQNHKLLDDSIERYREFLERVIKAKSVIRTRQEKRDIAESVLLRLCANWERFLEEHLIDCVNVNPSELDKFLGVSIPAHPSKNLCAALIFSDKYRSFASFDELKGFSRKLLPDDSNPFLAVTRNQIKHINEVYKIRNYLSHYSSKSRRLLQNMYSKEYRLNSFLQPGHFLLAHNAKRLWNYFKAFEGASNKMKSWCER